MTWLADADADDDDDSTDDDKEGWSSFRFTVVGNNRFRDQRNAQLEAERDERNDLIHHFLPRWNPASVESTDAACCFLDAQRDKAAAVRDQLKAHTQSLESGRTLLANFMASEAFGDQIELTWLQQSPLVRLLRDAGIQMARPDGWTVLAKVGRQMWLAAPEEVAAVREHYGHSTLKALLLASQTFDVMDEPTPKGGTRTIYRISPRSQSEVSAAPDGS